MTKTEKLIKSKIIYFNELKKGCSSFFNKLKEIPDPDRFKTGKCATCDDWKYCRGDSLHTWDFEKNEPKLCINHLLNGG